MNRLSFTLPDVGLREVKGMVFIEDGFLVLKLENALLGMVDAQRETIKIDPNALLEFSLKRGVFRDRLVLRPRRVELLDAVPGDHASAVELRIKRRYRYEARGLLAEFDALRLAS
jgi:hypothetical protein